LRAVLALAGVALALGWQKRFSIRRYRPFAKA